MLLTNLLTLPLMMLSNSTTFVFRVSTLLFALKSLSRSSIFIFSLSLSLGSAYPFSASIALLKKFDAIEIDEAYLDISTICNSYLFWAKLIILFTMLPAVPYTVRCVFKLDFLCSLQSLQAVL